MPDLSSLLFTGLLVGIGFWISRFVKAGKKVSLTNKHIGGLLALFSPALVFSPLLIAWLSALPDGNMYSESGPGSVIWLMFMTVPGGVLMLLAGVVVFFLPRKR